MAPLALSMMHLKHQLAHLKTKKMESLEAVSAPENAGGAPESSKALATASAAAGPSVQSTDATRGAVSASGAPVVLLPTQVLEG